MVGIAAASGANAVVTLTATGSGLCSSQGLPVKKVESSLQDINKAKGTTGTLKQNGSTGVTSSALFSP